MRVLTLTTNEEAPFLTQQLDALAGRGVDSSVLSVPGDPKADDGRNPVHYLRFLPSVWGELGRGYDLIHAHYGLLAPFALAQRRLPVVLSLWGSDLNGPIAPISRFGARYADEVVVMSTAMDNELNIDCHVIPDGVDLSIFEPRDRDAARAKVDWPTTGYDVLFPYAPTRSVKNHPRAKQIVEAVDAQFGDPVRLRTVSDVPHETMPTYMNAADALIITSHSEGSPNAVKEAMACGLPVVATAVGDVPERLADVEPSRIGETDRELVSGLATVLRDGRRSNGPAAVDALDLERTTEKILRVYRSAIGLTDGERDSSGSDATTMTNQ